MFYIKIYFTLIVSLSLLISSDNQVLVTIGNRTITKNEFIKRAEYTIRPAFCKGDNPIHKKIILNSLIAEKLMAIEIEENFLTDNYTTNIIEGIKEQKMRETLLNEEVYSLIEIDSSLVNLHLNYALRKYEVEYLSFNNDQMAVSVDSLFKHGFSFEEVAYNYLGLDEIPKRVIDYLNEKDPKIHNAIFSQNLSKNQIIGPVFSKDNKALFIKVKNYVQDILVTQQDKENQVKIIEQKLLENFYLIHYDEYVSKLMNGIELVFFKEGLQKLINNSIMQFNVDSSFNFSNLSNLDLLYNINNGDVDLLKIENNIYSIKDVDNLVKKHPLVFRKKNINKYSYSNELKYAIIDLIRDEYLNDLAYKKEYHFHPIVNKEVDIYRDAILSNIHLQTYLKGKGISINEYNNNYLKIINNDLNDYISSLFEKHSSKIYINFDDLNRINLTSIDLYAYKQGVPYTSIVPAFPILTNKHTIDYGNQISIP